MSELCNLYVSLVESALRNTPQKMLLSAKITKNTLKDSADTSDVTDIFGICNSGEGKILFADWQNQSVKELQLQTRTVKTLYKSDWRVLNVLQSGDGQTLYICEGNEEYLLFLRTASSLFSRVAQRKRPHFQFAFKTSN